MIFDLRRAPRALVRSAGAVLALVVALSIVAPQAALSANAPKIVSVDVTGNLHVPTADDHASRSGASGRGLRSEGRSGDLQRINALGYFADIAPPLVRARPDGVAITYRVIENPVITKIRLREHKVPSDTLLALMDLSVGQVFNTQHVPLKTCSRSTTTTSASATAARCRRTSRTSTSIRRRAR